MTTMSPQWATLAALTTAAQLAILLFLYRDNRARFFGWIIAAWVLRTAYFVIQLGPLFAGGSRLWAGIAALVSGANSVALLGSAVAYRRPLRLSPRKLLVVAGITLATAILLSAAPSAPVRLSLAAFEGAVLSGAAFGFRAPGAERVRGIGMLSASLLAWAAVRVGFGLSLPVDLGVALVPAAAVLQLLQMVAVIVVVLAGAKQRVEAMRTRLLDSERLATIGRMASRVAHEIRNPLGVMAIHTDLATGELTPEGSLEEAAGHLAIVKSEIRGVAQLIERYLRLGRIPQLELEPVDLDALVDGTLATFETELGVRGIALRRTSARRLPKMSADAEQLGQVLVNLIRNAIEAMPAGGELSIRTARADGGIEVEVADTGPGVQPDEVERIFRPFETTKAHGTGLGLTVAREIVQEHGGMLVCRPGHAGARFVVTLPIRRQRAQG